MRTVAFSLCRIRKYDRFMSIDWYDHQKAIFLSLSLSSSLLLSSSTSHRLKILFGPNKIHLHQNVYAYTHLNRFCSVCRFNGDQSKILIQFLCHHFCIKPMNLWRLDTVRFLFFCFFNSLDRILPSVRVNNYEVRSWILSPKCVR